MKSKIGSTILASSAILSTAVGFPSATKAETIEFRSAETKTSLVELFTSEGCSSCPPAERWLSGLKANSKLWKDYVVVAFHVDYWDGLGWKDPFARPEFSDRQRNYSAQWKTESVYTPGFVLDGREWRGWFDRESLPQSKYKKAGMLAATSTKAGEWGLQYDPSEPGANEKLTFSSALLGFGLNSKVKAGENSDRTLEHDFVVLKFATAASVHSDHVFRASISLPMNVTPNPERFGVAFWVTRSDDLRPIQAVGGWIAK